MVESDSGAFVRDVLDRAIAAVAEMEYLRLAEGMSIDDQTASVDHALKSLTRLQQARPPDYDSEWVSLFYVSWFQPHQVHLAYVALRRILAQAPLPRRVIDYGCGAWAVQLALSIILAEAPGPLGSGIAVCGIDSSEPMKMIGKRLWEEFRNKTNDTGCDGFFGVRLCHALELMGDSYGCYASPSEALRQLQVARKDSASENCWFTAVHAVYHENLEQLKDLLSSDKRQERGTSMELVTFDLHSGREGCFSELGFDKTELVKGAALLRRMLSPSFIRSYAHGPALARALWRGTASGQRLHPPLSGLRPA